MPLDVICPNCGECYFETNDEDGVLQTADERSREVLFRNFKKRDDVLFKSFDDKPATGRLSDYVRKYDPDAPATAAMIRMKRRFVGSREDIQHDRDLTGFAIEPCPNLNCGQSLSDDSFKFITRPQTDDPNRLNCKYCKRSNFKTVQGRATHEIQWCKENPNRQAK